MARFKKLDVPHQWKDEFTKYPHGYSIFEAISKWVDQLNRMVTNINQWNEYLGSFTSTFGEVPQQMAELRQEMTDLVDSINSDLTTINDEVSSLADTLLSHLTNYASYLASELGEEHIIRTLPNGVKDEIDLGTGKLIKRVSDEVIINGDLDWSNFGELDNVYRAFIYNWATENNVIQNVEGSAYGVSDDEIYINQNTSGPAATVSGVSFMLDRLYFYLAKDKLGGATGYTVDLNGLKNYLNDHPITLIYQLAETVEIPLPDPMSPNTREIVRLSEQVDKIIDML